MHIKDLRWKRGKDIFKLTVYYEDHYDSSLIVYDKVEWIKDDLIKGYISIKHEDFDGEKRVRIIKKEHVRELEIEY
jgi:hypothetical protein